MRRLGSILAVFMTIAGAAQGAEWIDLFNGKDLTGWESKNGNAKYEVVDGAIVGTSVPKEPNSFLCTTEEFGDFILEFEFKGHDRLNSGVMFRALSKEDYKNYRVHGYQCELEDEGQNRDWSGGIYDEARRGWLFPTKEDPTWGKLFGDQSKKIYKDGEWNHIRIECKGTSIRIWLNGHLRTDFRDAMTPKGFIGLQVHGVGDKTEPMSVSWKNIRIKKL